MIHHFLPLLAVADRPEWSKDQVGEVPVSGLLHLLPIQLLPELQQHVSLGGGGVAGAWAGQTTLIPEYKYGILPNKPPFPSPLTVLHPVLLHQLLQSKQQCNDLLHGRVWLMR